MKGVIPDASAEVDEIAYISIKLETGHEIKHVPFLVVESNFDILIGSNLVRSQRWSNFWKHNDFYVDVGKDKEPVKAVFCLLLLLKLSPWPAFSLSQKKAEMLSSAFQHWKDLKIPIFTSDLSS